MCGIAGYAGLKPNPELLERMMQSLHHRGPDDKGFVINNEIGLSMRRLSIIDLHGGKQPIDSINGALSIVFNGEIFNYRELRSELLQQGQVFQTHSDTEVILALYEKLGDRCVEKLRGMFAFAILDRRENFLFIARDRLGVKPLYYWQKSGVFLFASEIKAILEHPDVKREPDFNAMDSYLSLRYVPGPDTLFKGIKKFPAAHTMKWQSGDFKLSRYWTPRFSVPEKAESDAFYQERFASLFEESVRLRLISDVPVGAYLSGGVDSTAIVGAMSTLTNAPVRTFSVGFDWEGDELKEAREGASKLGTIHEEVICQSKDTALLPKVLWHLDEPVGDAIIVPMFLLSKVARESVTVVLSGEGADEGLAGYFPHKVLMWAKTFQKWVPPSVRKNFIEPLVLKAPAELLSLAFSYPTSLGVRGKQKLHDYLNVLDEHKLSSEYEFLISLFDARHKRELYTNGFRESLSTSELTYDGTYDLENTNAEYLQRILALQYSHWLPDDILMKQDKMNMANSIEGRVPFLDHKLVEFLAGVPPHLKMKGLSNKILLRRYLESRFPGSASNRPKKPFYIPIDKFFESGPLKEMVEVCLSEESVKKRGYFKWETVKFLKNNRNEKDFMIGKQLFSLLCLELWHRLYIDQEKGWL